MSADVPRIAHQLAHSTSPSIWKSEPHGNLGITDILEPQRAEIRVLLREYGIRRLRVYGSVARGEADGRSDVDLLVEWRRCDGLNSAERLAFDLGELLDCRVQVFTEEGTYGAVRDRVLSEATEF